MFKHSNHTRDQRRIINILGFDRNSATLAIWAVALVSIAAVSQSAMGSPSDSETSYEILSADTDEAHKPTASQKVYSAAVEQILTRPAARFLLIPTGFRAESIALHFGISVSDAERTTDFWIKNGELVMEPMPSLESVYEVTRVTPDVRSTEWRYYSSVFAESFAATEGSPIGGTVLFQYPWDLSPKVLFRVLTHEFAIRTSSKETTIEQLRLAPATLASLSIIDRLMLAHSLDVISPVLHLNRAFQLEAAIAGQADKSLGLTVTSEDKIHGAAKDSPEACFHSLQHDLGLYEQSLSGNRKNLDPKNENLQTHLAYLRDLSLNSSSLDLKDICQKLIENTPVPFTSSGPGPRVGGF